VKNKAKPQTRANGRSLLISLTFIVLFASTLAAGVATDHYRKSINVKQFRLTGGREQDRNKNRGGNQLDVVLADELDNIPRQPALNLMMSGRRSRIP
jgi:hypothetical protein